MAVSKNIFQKIHLIHFWTKKLVDELLAGAYKSAFKGRGLEFEEVREYVEGDDVRYIDWNVTSRIGNPYVKTFKEERGLTVMLLVDVSSSLSFGTKFLLKKERIAELSAMITISAVKNSDKVGLLLFSSEIEKYVPPKRGQRHVLRVIRELLAYHPRKKTTSIKEALSFLGKVQTKPCVIFLISDFLTGESFDLELKILSKRHDLVGIQIIDPVEDDFPSLALFSMKDLEEDKVKLIDTQDPKIHEEMRKTRKAFEEKLKTLFSKWGEVF